MGRVWTKREVIHLQMRLFKYLEHTELYILEIQIKGED